MKRVSLLFLLALLAVVAPATFAQGFTLYQPTDAVLMRDLPTDFTLLQWTALPSATNYTVSLFQVSTNPGANTRGIGTVFNRNVATSACGDAGGGLMICSYFPNGADYALMARGEFAWTVVATTGSGNVEASNAPFYFSYEPNPIALVPNANFEAATLDPWKLTNKTGDKLKAGVGTDGSTGFQFKGGAGENSQLKQKIAPNAYNIRLGDTLTFSADYTAKGALNGRFIVTIKYKKAAGLNPTKVNIPVSVNPTFVNVSQNIAVQGPVKKLVVGAINNSTGGKWVIDNVQLVLN